MPSRLASNYPQLQRELDAVIPSEALEMAVRIVLWAASEAGLDRRDIVRTLAKNDAGLFDELCAEMEEQQFTLFEYGDTRHLAFFNKARAYNASAWLVRGVPHEAIYESIFATDKPFVMNDFFRS
ncbi:hypothetical protein GIW70_03160 [Pseudomonas syringae]|nr:hypothetical protein [Pseudomonas syringae]MCF5067196.1 hypothetical protein [Pseudomonas syringae]